MKFYSHLYADNGCCFHRLLQPSRFLKLDFPEHQFHVNTGQPDDSYDVYHVHGLLSINTIEQIGVWQAKGKKVIWNVDDNYTCIPKWNPCYHPPETLGTWYLAKKTADVIVASTPALAESIGEPDKTLVARNLLDLSFYRPQKTEEDKVMLAWTGSNTHSEDLSLLQPALDHVLSKYNGKISVLFFGYCHPDLMRDWLHKGLIIQEAVHLGLYHQVLSAISPDIYLAPLADEKFNESKSNIRVLEGWALESAVIGSPVGEYKVIEDGKTGLVAENTDEWVSKLEKLIEDANYRKRLARAGREQVELVGDWGRRECRKQWQEAIKQAVI